MNNRRHRLLLAMLPALVLTASPVAAAGPSAGNADLAREWLARTHGGGATEFSLVEERRVAAGGARMWAGKFEDVATGEIRTVYVAARGRAGGPEVREDAIKAERRALGEVEHKASWELRERAAKAAPDELLPVAMWLDASPADAIAAVIAAHPEGQWDGDRPMVDDLATQRAMRRLLDAARSQVYAAAARAVEATVRAAGGRIGYASVMAPLVYVDLPARSIPEVAADRHVRSMGLEGMQGRQSLAQAGPEIEANWTTGTGDQGTGVRVGVIEYYNVRETGDLADRVVASFSTSGTLRYTGAGVFDHPTWVAGAVASQDAVDRGVAPGAVIVSASTGGGAAGLTRDRNVIRAADWAAVTGDADIINMSVNMDSTTGRDEARAYFDALGGGEATRTVVASSGNYGSGVDARWLVSSPGVGWNVLTVGGMNDATNRLWYVTSPCCSGAQWEERAGVSYNDHGDFNKPDVSAPAVAVRTANGLSASGTSVATPMVAGIASQLMARYPVLVSQPEAVRALVMASARRRTPMPGGGTSRDHEGVGTVNARWANRLLVKGGGPHGGFDFGAMTSSDAFTRTFPVAAGQQVRVVLAWDSHTTGPMFDKTDTLRADLDLVVTYPGGKATSASWNNSHEFVKFTAKAAGTVSVRVSAPTFRGSREQWALAWAKW